MSFSIKEVKDYGILGAVLGVATPYALKGISAVLSFIPGVNVNLQSVAISTTGVGTAVNTGLSVYAQKVVGLIPIGLTVPELFYSALGGAAFLILGAFLYDLAKPLQFAKSKIGKLTTILVIAGLVSGAIVSMSLAIPTATAMIAMVLNGLLLSWLVSLVDKHVYKIIP
jgi:hypothetical protein